VDIPSETARRQALHALQLLDTPAEPEYDALVELAREVCDAPIALVSLVDQERQWFKARAGIAVSETPRAHAFCAHTIESDGPLIVPDARRDSRFCNNPLVTGEPRIRAYLGVPVRSDAGLRLGTLCVIDTRSRLFSEKQTRRLSQLAAQLEQLLRLRSALMDLDATRRRERVLERRMQQEQTRAAHRLAADLHDGLGQDLTGISLAFANFLRDVSPAAPAHREEAKRIQMLLEAANQQCRTLAYGQAAFVAPHYGLARAVRMHVASIQSLAGATFECEIRTGADQGLSANAAYQVLRIIQEALANARNHSAASKVRVVIDREGTQMLVRIEDDGVGLTDGMPPGVGLQSMQYRAAEVGATLQFVRTVPHGLTVTLGVPCGEPP
jgi:signal transduction histidine kinase